jgi:hypothetical protein
MRRNVGRLLWWLIVTERPTRPADYMALAFPFVLLVLGALALSWPWVSEETPRTVSAAATTVWTAIADQFPHR